MYKFDIRNVPFKSYETFIVWCNNNCDSWDMEVIEAGNGPDNYYTTPCFLTITDPEAALAFTLKFGFQCE